jgi:shikimate kinase
VLIYITGVPGSGKSTVCDALRGRGYSAVDADVHIGAWMSRDTGKTLADHPAFSSRTPQFYEHHLWRYQLTAVEDLAATYTDTVCFVGGCAAGDDEILHLFGQTFFLHVESDELTHRLLSRTNGPFADASDAQRAAQVYRVLPHREASEATWHRAGFAMVSAMQPLAAVVDDILTRCGLPLRTP